MQTQVNFLSARFAYFVKFTDYVDFNFYYKIFTKETTKIFTILLPVALLP